MRKLFPDYSEFEEQARDLFGDSKPIVARYVAKQLEVKDEVPGWGKYKELADAIRKVSCPADGEAPGYNPSQSPPGAGGVGEAIE